jgi:hypothetical protein
MKGEERDLRIMRERGGGRGRRERGSSSSSPADVKGKTTKPSFPVMRLHFNPSYHPGSWYYTRQPAMLRSNRSCHCQNPISC